MRSKEREQWMTLVGEMQAQINKMADRLQHPERTPVDPSEPVEWEVPKDSAELAQVGQIVPEFVQVGGDE